MTVEIRVPRPRRNLSEQSEGLWSVRRRADVTLPEAGERAWWPVRWFRAVLRGTDPSLAAVSIEAYYFDGVRV